MAKISLLPELVTPEGNEMVPVLKAGFTKRARLDLLVGAAALPFLLAANDNANRAELARDAAMLAGHLFKTIAAGLLGTPEGGYFSVPGDGDAFATLYQKLNGAAVKVSAYPSLEAVLKGMTVTSIQSFYSPGFTDAMAIQAMFDEASTKPMHVFFPPGRGRGPNGDYLIDREFIHRGYYPFRMSGDPEATVLKYSSVNSGITYRGTWPGSYYGRNEYFSVSGIKCVATTAMVKHAFFVDLKYINSGKYRNATFTDVTITPDDAFGTSSWAKHIRLNNVWSADLERVVGDNPADYSPTGRIKGSCLISVEGLSVVIRVKACKAQFLDAAVRADKPAYLLGLVGKVTGAVDRGDVFTQVATGARGTVARGDAYEGGDLILTEVTGTFQNGVATSPTGARIQITGALDIYQPSEAIQVSDGCEFFHVDYGLDVNYDERIGGKNAVHCYLIDSHVAFYKGAVRQVRSSCFVAHGNNTAPEAVGGIDYYLDYAGLSTIVNNSMPNGIPDNDIGIFIDHSAACQIIGNNSNIRTTGIVIGSDTAGIRVGLNTFFGSTVEIEHHGPTEGPNANLFLCNGDTSDAGNPMGSTTQYQRVRRADGRNGHIIEHAGISLPHEPVSIVRMPQPSSMRDANLTQLQAWQASDGAETVASVQGDGSILGGAFLINGRQGMFLEAVSPEGVRTAPMGSLCLVGNVLDPSSPGSVWFKSSGIGKTGWLQLGGSAETNGKLTAGPVLAGGTTPLSVTDDLSLRIPIQRFGAQAAGMLFDNTDAFNRAIASKLPVEVPETDNYYWCKALLIDEGGARMIGRGLPRIVVPRPQGYLQIRGEGSIWRNFRFEPVQANTAWGIDLLTTARYNELSNIEIVLGNSGIRCQGPHNRFDNIRMREMRGTCFRVQGPQAYRNTLTHFDMRNGALAGILFDDGAAYNFVSDAYKWVDPAYFNAFLLAQREAVNGRLGGDVCASTIECHHNQWFNIRCDNARDGCCTISGDDNIIDGGLFNDGFATGLNVSGSRNKISNVQSVRCKTGFWVFPQAGGLGKDNVYTNCHAEASTQFGWRHENRPYRAWVANLDQVPATHFCNYGTQVYQCSPAASIFGDQPPVHTSGTVSDGLVDWKWVSGTTDTLDADRNFAHGCTSFGSATADWYAEGVGKLTRVGCPGFAPISVVPTYTYDSTEASPVYDSPVLVNGESHFWPNGTTVPISSAATYGPGGWRGSRGAGTGTLSQVRGEQSPYATRIQRTPGDTSSTSLYFHQILTGEAVYKLRGQKLSAVFRARAGANWASSNGRLSYGIYCSSTLAPPTTSGVPSGALTLASSSMIPTATFVDRPFNTGDTIVPLDAEMITLRFNWTSVPDAAGAADYIDIECPALSPGKAAAVYIAQSVNVTKLRLNLYYVGTPPAPVIGTTSNYAVPLTMTPGATGGVATVAGTRYFYPTQAPNLALTALAIEVTTAAAAGVKCRMAIYAHDDATGGPGALVVDAGEIDCSTIGEKTLAIPNYTPAGAWFWIMIQTSAAVTFRTSDKGIAVLGTNALSSFIKGRSEATMAYGPAAVSAPAATVNTGLGPICGVKGIRA